MNRDSMIICFFLSLFELFKKKKKKTLVGDKTLMNTNFELSIPGFMNINFIKQIRQEGKIGGGGSAITYKGTLLDPKLRDVSFLSFLFFSFLFFIFFKKIEI